MIGLLENLVCANAGLLHDAETFHIQRGGVDVDSTNGTVALLHRIRQFGGVRNELRRVFRRLTINENQTLLAVFFQCLNVVHKLLIGERGTHLFFVGGTETTIFAIINTVVAHIQRGKKHNAVAVDTAFQFARTLFNLLHQLRFGSVDEHGGLFQSQTILVQGFLDDFAHPLGRAFRVVDVIPQFIGIDEGFSNFVGDTTFFRMKLHDVVILIVNVVKMGKRQSGRM